MCVLVGRGWAVGPGTFFACLTTVYVGFMLLCLYSLVAQRLVPALPAAFVVGFVVYLAFRFLDIDYFFVSIFESKLYF